MRGKAMFRVVFIKLKELFRKKTVITLTFYYD